MPKLTLKAARDLQSSFKGRITSSHEAHAEFRGKPTVLIPESIEDVERALRLAQAANRRVFVRSGRSISATDVTKPAAAARSGGRVSKPAAAIVSMEAFRDVDVSDQRVTVGAAATTGDVAKKLADKSLFLPLDDNPTQSVVSAVLSMDASPFLRSGTGFGPLRNAVVEAEVVPIEGAGAGRSQDAPQQSAPRRLGRRPPRGDHEARLRRRAPRRRTNPTAGRRPGWRSYERKTFAALCDALFGAGARKVPERVDLSVRVTSAAYSMKLVIVRATGHGDAHKAAEAVVQAAFKKRKARRARVRAGGRSRLERRHLGGDGSGRSGAGRDPERGSAATPRLGRSPSFGERSSMRSTSPSASTPAPAASGPPVFGPGRSSSSRRAASVVARAEILRRGGRRRRSRRRRGDRMAAAIPADKASPTAAVARRALVRRAATRAALRGVEVLPEPRADARLRPGVEQPGRQRQDSWFQG